MSKRKCRVMLVTPEVAQRWLEDCNAHNRPLRETVILRFMAALKRGEWKLTPEPIAFSGPYTDECNEVRGQTLINGQHRLWAVFRSGIAAEFTVWWGCEPDEFSVIDQGAPRTLGDVLATTRRDLPAPTLVASVCGSVACYALGRNSSNGGSRLTANELASMLRVFESDLLAVADYKKRLRKFAPRVVMSALFLARLIDADKTDAIVSQLQDSTGFTERDPMRALHMYVANWLAGGHRDTEDVMHYKVCHAFAARLHGAGVKHLRTTGDGLAWLREAARGRINGLVTALHGGRVPVNFYSPKVMDAA